MSMLPECCDNCQIDGEEIDFFIIINGKKVYPWVTGMSIYWDTTDEGVRYDFRISDRFGVKFYDNEGELYDYKFTWEEKENFKNVVNKYLNEAVA